MYEGDQSEEHFGKSTTKMQADVMTDVGIRCVFSRLYRGSCVDASRAM